jgi:hypothetical protein
VKTVNLEVICLSTRRKTIPQHKAPGEITVPCREGQWPLQPLQQVRINRRAIALPFGRGAACGPSDRGFLVARDDVVARIQHRQKLDVVKEASEESFPARDAPAIGKRSDVRSM